MVSQKLQLHSNHAKQKQITTYIPIKANKHPITVKMKSLEGIMAPAEASSSSQFNPVCPRGHTHSYLKGGLWSMHRPPLMQGNQWHSFMFTHCRSCSLYPARQLETSLKISTYLKTVIYAPFSCPLRALSILYESKVIINMQTPCYLRRS